MLRLCILRFVWSHLLIDVHLPEDVTDANIKTGESNVPRQEELDGGMTYRCDRTPNRRFTKQ